MDNPRTRAAKAEAVGRQPEGCGPTRNIICSRDRSLLENFFSIEFDLAQSAGNAAGGMRFGFMIAAAGALFVIASAPAQAGLVGAGTNTVSVNFWIPSSSVPPPACDPHTIPIAKLRWIRRTMQRRPFRRISWKARLTDRRSRSATPKL